jgi:hypothetical protein
MFMDDRIAAGEALSVAENQSECGSGIHAFDVPKRPLPPRLHRALPPGSARRSEPT